MKLRFFAAAGPVLCALSVVVAGPAAADTRGDVLARVQHCGVIPDGRKWLDCYYAAAQPLRAELGLAPAPQAQGYTSFFAAPAPPPEEEEDHGLLTSLLASSVKVPPEQFGLRDARPGPGLNVDHLTLQLSAYSIPRNGFIVTLANGQVWRELPDTGDIPTWRAPAATYAVTISRGAFGSYNLRVGDDATLYKVERLK